MSLRIKALAVAAAAVLASSAGVAATWTTAAQAAPAPLPPYPATTTLNLGSPNCVTDDVIMNDPLDSTSPITDTYGSAGSPVVFGHETPPVHYYLWHLNTLNVWVLSPPLGVQINPLTGVLSAEGPGAPPIAGDQQGGVAAPGTVTYTVRDHGKDSVGAVGTEQFQVRVDNTGTATTLLYEGNTFNNANGALTIGLNAGSTNSTALTLAAIASSLHIPGSTPVTFTLAPGSPAGWHITANVLTGVSTSDPEIIATTANHDVVFFTLSGISTDSGGVFFTNTDANPCVTGLPDTVDVANPGTQTTTVNHAATLNISATTPNGDAITSYSASGLPAGLSINPSTGVITGTPNTVATNSVTVTASDSDESGSATFTWAVQALGTPPPSSNTAACTSSYGNEVNPYGNGLDAFRQGAFAGNEIVGWPATQADPATHFLCSNTGGVLRFQYAPHGAGTGLCVSNPGNDLLVLRACNLNIWQQFTASGRFLISSFDGKFVVPGGTGVQLAASATHSPWGGDRYTWTPFASLP